MVDPNIKLHIVEEKQRLVFKRNHWFSLKKHVVVEYTYIVTLDGEFVSGDWYDYTVAQQQAKHLNTILLKKLNKE